MKRTIKYRIYEFGRKLNTPSKLGYFSEFTDDPDEYEKAIELEFKDQTKRYNLNGIDYDSVSEMPKRFRGAVQQYIDKDPSADFYRFVAHEDKFLLVKIFAVACIAAIIFYAVTL